MVQIVTDSTCDLTRERLAEIGVIAVPLTIHFGDQTYIDGENLTTKEFYHHLRNEKELPKTAQPTPAKFEDVFQHTLAEGNDVLCILLSSHMSGTVQSANVAKQAVGSDRIIIIDTLEASASLGLLVEIAAQKAAEGMTLEELYTQMCELAGRARIYSAIETLKFVRKGGRLSGPAAVVGTMLNLHPIIASRDGLAMNIGKVKGKKKMITVLKQYALEEGVDTDYPILFCHGDGEENFKKLVDCFAEDYDLSNARFGLVGPAIGTYSGPGIVAVGFIAKNQNKVVK